MIGYTIGVSLLIAVVLTSAVVVLRRRAVARKLLLLESMIDDYLAEAEANQHQSIGKSPPMNFWEVLREAIAVSQNYLAIRNFVVDSTRVEGVILPTERVLKFAKAIVTVQGHFAVATANNLDSYQAQRCLSVYSTFAKIRALKVLFAPRFAWARSVLKVSPIIPTVGKEPALFIKNYFA